jgi:hypothetical protein
VNIGKPWLVQRAKFRNIPVEHIDGVNSLFDFDYMGSAEFEFGALPKSLHAIVDNVSEYHMVVVPSVCNRQREPMYLYCHKGVTEQANSNAIHLSKEMYGYKEWCDMPNYLAGEKSYRVNDFWWDILGHYMICFGKDNADRVQVAIQKMVEKWNKAS